MIARNLSPLGLGLVLSLAACGGAAPVPTKSSTPRTGVPVARAEARAPSPALARYWPFAGPVSTAAYVDVAGMSRTVAGDEKVVLPILALAVDADRKESLLRCARDALGRTREVIFGGSREASFLALSAVPGGAQAIATSCFDGNPAFARAAPPPRADEGWSGTDSDGSPLLVARVGDVILLGTPATVTGALTPPASPPPFPVSLSLAGDQYAALDADIDGSLRGHFSLADSDRHLALETDITVSDASAADALADKLRALTTWPANAFEGSPTPAITGSLHRLSAALTIQRSGTTVTARFELVEPPEVQAYDVAICANLTASVIQYTVRQAELAEPRATLPAIAQRYAEATDVAAKKTHAGKRLKSYPPVPASVPASKAVTSSIADWAAWKPLAVELVDPQHFQYEIVADRKGLEADVVARGDLEGTGTVSTLKVHVAVDPRSREIVVGDVVEDAKPGE